MSRIFISYKRVDKDKVFKIKDQIESALGEKCWIDVDGIESDAQFKNVIIRAINECEIVLFMYSKAHSKIVDFENDWTVRELDFAKDKKKRIVFINVDGSPLVDEFKFDYGRKQQVDARSPYALSHLIDDLGKWLRSTTIIHSSFQNAQKHSQVVNISPKRVLGYVVASSFVCVAILVLAIVIKGLQNSGEITQHLTRGTGSLEEIPITDYHQLRIGDYVYEDGSFSHSLIKGREAVGCVFSLHTTARERQKGWTHGVMISLKDCDDGEYFQWCKSDSLDGYPWVYYEQFDHALHDREGYNYTYGYSYITSHYYPAFGAVRRHMPKLEFASKWYLPTIAQWYDILTNLGHVSCDTNVCLSYDSELAYNNLSKYGFSKDYYWSSTVGPYLVFLGIGDFNGFTVPTNQCKVRAIAAF